LGASALASGCLERDLKALNPCLVSAVARQIAVTNVDFVDILFVVDNSGSMRQEQAALRDQFPKLINTMTQGMKSDGMQFPPVKDMHLGVVSTDMGLVGIRNNYPGCNTQRHYEGGDDGVLQHKGMPGVSGCKADYPAFLAYEQDLVDPEQLATDFGCIANLGTTGCGFEQPLEAGLKALWPKHYTDANGKTYAPDDNPILFLSTTPEGRYGHGDQPISAGGNQGFLRNDANVGVSLIAIILVSDEEDCSSQNTDHFKQVDSSDTDDPLAQQPINLRCYYNKQNLYETERYVEGYKGLRPANNDLVIFGAIVGVPPELVDAEAREGVDFLSAESSSRDEYYDKILAHPMMQERPVGTNQSNANLAPSCSRKDILGEVATAYPPIRIVEVAKSFGPNAIIQSICQDDFGPAMDVIIDLIAVQLSAVCLPRALVRQSSGTVPCSVIWELPKEGTAPDRTPTECDEPFLTEVTGDGATNDRGGRNCIVDQLAITRVGEIPKGAGWYYDDFTEERAAQCRSDQPQRVSFTEVAKPRTGVTVKLQCLNETQNLANTRADIKENQPAVGTPCATADEEGNSRPDDSLCLVELKDGSLDDSMFCHAEANVCFVSCSGSSDCPAGWVCDERESSAELAGGRAYCVNPTCGAQ
jgi:hypothetical protein